MLLLQTRKKKKYKKIKYTADEVYTERIYQKVNEKLPISNVISNDNYTIVMNQKRRRI